MKVITQVLKVIVSFYFLLYGFLKVNDPVAYSYKLNDYLLAFGEQLKTEQPKFFIELTSNSESLIKLTQPLDPSQKVIKINIESKPEISDVDSTGIPTLFTEYVLFTLNGKNVGTYSRDYSDSFQTVLYSLTCQINQESLLSQSIVSSTLEKSAIQKVIPINKYLLPQTSAVKICNSLTNYTTYFSIALGILELILGFVLLFGYRIKIFYFILFVFSLASLFLAFYSLAAAYNPTTIAHIVFGIWLLATLVFYIMYSKFRNPWLLITPSVLLILFFVLCFTTNILFTQHYNPNEFKITDSSHYANAIQISPWWGFVRNLILSIFLILIGININYVKPWFSAKFSNKLILVLIIIISVLATYSTLFLPLLDFSPFAKGTNLQQLANKNYANNSSSITVFYKVKKGSVKKTIVSTQIQDYLNNGYHIIPNSRIQKIKKPFYLANNSDFALVENESFRNCTNQILDSSKKQIWFVAPSFATLHAGHWSYIKKLNNFCNQYNIKFVLLGSMQPLDSKSLVKIKSLNVQYVLSDQRNVYSMSHAKATIYFIYKNTVQNKWSINQKPSNSKIKRNLSKVK